MSMPSKDTRQLREMAMSLFEGNDLSIAEVARRVGVSRPTCSQWHTLWKEQGADFLDRKNPGKEPRLSAEQKQQLAQLIISGPTACGYPYSLWTLERLADLIEKTMGVHYHISSVWRLLNEIGFSCQKPVARAKERNEEAIGGWLAQDWPQIKKGPSSGRPS